MTAAGKGIGESGAQGPSRRGVLLGASLAGLGGALAGCSTAAVPYDANEAGVPPGGGASAMAMPGAAAASSAPAGAAASGSAMPAGTASAMPRASRKARPTASRSARPASTHPAGQASARARTTGKVLGAASEIPVGGGRIFTADKVVVTQPVRDKYLAFSAVCTHVGCILDRVAGGVIGCPCHGGEFAISNGTVVAGPPPTPLARKSIEIIDGKVVLM